MSKSKDGSCYLETLEPWQVSNFYTSCRKCGNCKNLYTPDSTDPREQSGNKVMIAFGYFKCSTAKKPEEKGRWHKEELNCSYPERFKQK